MHRTWLRNIHEPEQPGEVSKPITELWDALPFWDKWLRVPLPDGGGCPNGYTRPPDPNWCLVLVAYVGINLGRWIDPTQCVDVQVDPELAKYVLTSTDRLENESKWKQAGHEQPDPLPASAILEGHIVTVRPTASRPWGTHGLVAAGEPDEAGEFPTYEGNAEGVRADGSRGKGVIANTRNLSEVARVWPILPEHLVRATS